MFGFWTNLIICLLILIVSLVILLRITKIDDTYTEENISTSPIDFLKYEVKSSIEEILDKDVSDLNLNKEESLKRSRIKVEIQANLRLCGQGNLGAKLYIKDIVQDILVKKSVKEENINHFIPFEEVKRMTYQDKFEILLFYFKKRYHFDALRVLIEKYKFDYLKKENGEEFYELSSEDIEKAYQNEKISLSFMDKVEIITQRVYQELYGLSVIDEIRDMKIDGVSGGVSGIPFEFYSYDMEWIETVKKENLSSYQSVWMFFKGNSYRLSFLGFGSQNELIRVCKTIYKYGKPGQFSEERGYIANEMKDGSRLVVFRPPLSSSWAFFVRKSDSISKKDFKSLIKDKGNELVEFFVRSLVRANQTILITGEQGSGKTTLLLSLLEFLGRTVNLRVYELIFELYAQKIYPKMNILSLRDTSTVSNQEALDIIKKTDGTVTVLGEVATYEASTHLMDIRQVNNKSVLGTHHANTTPDIVDYFRNGWLRVGGFSDERLAEEQVIKALNFDIHMVNVKGHRYIERITEIVPLQKQISKNLRESMYFFFERMSGKSYEVVDILRFENGEYKFKNHVSIRVMQELSKNLSKNELEQFMRLFENVTEEPAYEY